MRLGGKEFGQKVSNMLQMVGGVLCHPRLSLQTPAFNRVNPDCCKLRGEKSIDWSWQMYWKVFKESRRLEISWSTKKWTGNAEVGQASKIFQVVLLLLLQLLHAKVMEIVKVAAYHKCIYVSWWMYFSLSSNVFLFELKFKVTKRRN